MTASNPELVPLIYRHLKEHGFNTAADELQKLSPQNDAPSSTSLLDIYTAWLKSSKRRKKPATSKPSTSDQKQTTPKKAAQRKNTNKTTKPGSKSGSPNKKSTPTKRKKDDGKSTEKTVVSNKRDALKEEAAVGEDSDSDSSLDVEKWKKLVQEMTDADLLKVEAFNALATPEPKKQRVRKPRAKPKPKTETVANGQGPQSEKSDKTTKDVLVNTTPAKKSHSKKAAPVALSGISNEGQNNKTPVASVISTSKKSPKKEKRKGSDQVSLEPKRKKKKQTIQFNATTNANIENGLIDKNIDNTGDKMISLKEKSQENTINLQTEPEKKKKKQKTHNVVGKSTGGDSLINKDNNDSKDVKTVSPTQIEHKDESQVNMTNLQTEPKKKKKKQMTQNVTENSTGGDGLIHKNNDSKDVKTVSPTQIEHKDESQVNTSNLQTESKKIKKKKTNKDTTDSNVIVEKNLISREEDLNANLPAENLTISLNTSNVEADSTVRVKKKKKKKDKAEDDGNSQQVLSEAKTNSAVNEGTCGKTMEEASPNTEVPKKKKKKKDKAEVDGNSQPPVSEASTNSAISEGTCEKKMEEDSPNSEVPKKKKKKKDKNKGESEALPQRETDVFDKAVCVEENAEQIVTKKKSKKKKEFVGAEDETVTTEHCEIPEEPPDPPFTPQTPGSKKKKQKLDLEKLVKADAMPPTQECETPNKKKKKASRSKETKS